MELTLASTLARSPSRKHMAVVIFVFQIYKLKLRRPITSTSPARNYWGIDASLAYGDTTLLSTTAGIVDTGV